ncbi:MAG: MMPL family transporter [Chitinivibrionales bacterium]|nr:MMPL family transporter [Chitinivibrionales bacterium]
MKKLVEYFIKYPVWANVLMGAILVFGASSLLNMKTSFFPELESKVITVTVTYPGASPTEIEEGIVLKIERNLEGIQGIDRTSSVSRENIGIITVEVGDKYSVDKAYDDIKNAIDRIADYPEGAEKPLVAAQKFRARTISVALFGDADLWSLKERAEEFREQLIAVEGISQVSLQGLPSREIAIEASESDMRRYKLTFADIAQAVRAANIDISGGTLRTPEESILIRAYGRKDFADEVGDIILRSLEDGTILRVRDIASVREKWEESPNLTFLNNQRAIVVTVDKTREEDLLYIAEKVKEVVPAFAEMNPEINIQIVEDATILLKERIDLLRRNGIIGFALVIIVLTLFLNWRISGWVAVGIPISFAGMFIIANFAGITLNVISLFGMIIVVGILVDDAIVVAESIFQRYEQGMRAEKAAAGGLLAVVAPVFTSVLTTILAFTPFFFFQGQLGSFIWQLALVVVGTLIFSLLESFFILPSHLAHSKGLQQSRSGKMRKALESLHLLLAHRLYAPALRWSLKNVPIVLAIALVFIFITSGLVRGKFVEFSPQPFIDRDEVNMNIALTTGTNERVTDSVLHMIERKAWALNTQLKQERPDNKDVILSVKRDVGSNRLGDEGSHAGQLTVELLPARERNMRAYVVANRLRNSVGMVPGMQKFSFLNSFWGKPISVSLLSDNLTELEKAKNLLKARLAEFSDLKDIVDSDVEGQREIRLTLTPAAHAAGLALSDIAGQIRQGFFGYEIQRFQRGQDEIRIWVRYRDEDRAALGYLENMRIRTAHGQEFPLKTLATHQTGRGRAAIRHLNGQREVRVEADMANPEASSAAIMEEIKDKIAPEVLARVHGVQVSYEGRERNNAKFAESFKTSFPPALIGIVILLILVFRSPLQSLLIIIMIPFGLAGAIWGHFFHGMLVSRLSTFGLIALAGIVINDSIVLIDQININLRKGMALFDAVHAAGVSRLRAIVLTTITTVAGMMPLILENSTQAQFLIPMAISISYGLIFGSIFILFFAPTLFMILNSVRYYYERVFTRNISRESVEPAVLEAKRLGEFPPQQSMQNETPA